MLIDRKLAPIFFKQWVSFCLIGLHSVTPVLAHFEDPSTKDTTPHAVAPAFQQHKSDHHNHSILQPAHASISSTRIWMNGDKRMITSDAMPDSPYGQFPNAGNPNVITEQRIEYQVPVHPTPLSESVSEHPHVFGVGLDGVPFDPGTAEFWRNDPNSGWHGEAMTAKPDRLGLDMNNAHVQPDGLYHYHGIPVSLWRRLGGSSKATMVGWAADGYPIYGPKGHLNSHGTASSTTTLHSSYRLKSGSRPGENSPGGTYDGTYSEDFEYIEGCGDLDECNGRTGKTAEFPNGTYYYVLTEEFPYVPRRWHGQADSSFFKHGPGGGGRGGFGRGPQGGFGGRPQGPPPSGPDGRGGHPEFGPGFGPGFGPPPGRPPFDE